MVVDRSKGPPSMSRGLVSRGKLGGVGAKPGAETSLHVAIRIRPILSKGVKAAEAGMKDIIRVMNDKVVIVLDPDEQKDYLDQVQGRTKEKKYTFDIAFGTDSRNCDVYDGTIRELVLGCMNGLNVTVFAYGATGSGKTYTMVGSPADPGLMVLSLERIFRDRQDLYADEDFEVTCSYIEVYNEVIYDLLVRNSGPLELREDPSLGVQVAGIKKHGVNSPSEIMALLEEGNTRRKTESTNANATSSRSHAVLEVTIVRKPRNQYKTNTLRGKLSLVDLAGSERAAETNNAGQKLRDGANINRSLLALANCINALGKKGKSGMAYVPYRNSKLTRLLKDGLSGNSKTAMIATVSCSSDQYNHSINTLKYADRAKEIKTHVSKNVGSVESHVSDYQRIIDNLQTEVQQLKNQLEQQPTPSEAETAREETQDQIQMKWLDNLSSELNENTEERINLQKALYELEDMNVCIKCELQQLENYLQSGLASRDETTEARERIQGMKANIIDNEEAGLRYRADIEANENQRKAIQDAINQAMESNKNTSFLQVLSTFRMQAVRLQELQFQMAVRDQVISEQRDVITNLWRVIEGAGMDREQIQAVAMDQGILVEGLGNPDSDTPMTYRPAGAPVFDRDDEDGSPKPRTPRGGGVRVGPAALPLANQSIYGARAQYRYDFWQNYDSAGPDANMGTPSDELDSGALTAQQRPASSFSDNGTAWAPDSPHGRSKVIAARRSDEGFPAAHVHVHGESSAKAVKASPAKHAQGTSQARRKAASPSSGSPQVMELSPDQDPRSARAPSGRSVYGQRGPSSKPRHPSTRTAQEEDSFDELGDDTVARRKPLTNAWVEEKTTPGELGVVGQGSTRPPAREGGRLASQLGRLKGRLISGRAEAKPPVPAGDVDSLRVDGRQTSETRSQAEAAQPVHRRRKSQIDRLKNRHKSRTESPT
mmetsp:Transcript_11268/g.28907  ORF Transcript_11268/g.28907 Transcript_11268/m.28907 type:complete len:941 (+) Transcript_11268:278-3100(+)